MAFKDWLTGNWAKRILRLFGILHLLYGGLGLYLLFHGVFLSLSLGSLHRVPPTYAPYRLEAYILRTSINLIFLIILVIAGLLLLRARRQGVRLSNVLFIAMIVYVLDPFYLGLFGEAFRSSMAATAGTGGVGITLQIVTGYPLICLIALNLAARKLPKPAPADQPSPTRG